MNPAIPNLLVIRSDDIDQAVNFYRLLAFDFVKHSHGKGPEHYAVEVEGFVFEIYPASERFPATASTRLGFVAEAIDDVIKTIKTAGYQVLSQPADSPWGRRAVVSDLDGHRVELAQRQ